jgi:hypothetical protein
MHTRKFSEVFFAPSDFEDANELLALYRACAGSVECAERQATFDGFTL